MPRIRATSRSIVAVGVAVAALSTAACGGGSSSGSTTSDDGVLRFATFTVPDTFDPVKRNSGTSGLNFLFPVYDALIRTNADGSLAPGLATEWKLQQDGLLLTLREGVTFSDGEAFDAAAAAGNIERCRAAGGGCAATLDQVTGTEVIDPQTLLVTTDGPAPSLPFALTTGAGMMVSPAAFDSPDLGRLPVGAGAYVLDEKATVAGSTWVYTKNPDYWDPEAQTLDRIELVVIDSSQQRVAAMRTGQVDASMIGDAEERDSYEQAGFDTTVAEGGDAKGILVVDPTGPFADQRVRQAVGYALDREALTGTPARKDMSTPSTQLFAPGSVGNVDDPAFAYEYDPEKAKALLAEAGVGKPKLVLPANPGPLNKSETEAVAGMLNAVGFDASVTQPPPQNVTREMFSGTYPLAYTPVFVPDAASLAGSLDPEGGFMNPGGHELGEANKLADEAANAAVDDPERSAELFGDMMATLAEDGYVIPVYWSPTGVAFNDDVHGLVPWAGAFMGPPFYGVTVGGK